MVMLSPAVRGKISFRDEGPDHPIQKMFRRLARRGLGAGRLKMNDQCLPLREVDRLIGYDRPAIEMRSNRRHDEQV